MDVALLVLSEDALHVGLELIVSVKILVSRFEAVIFLALIHLFCLIQSGATRLHIDEIIYLVRIVRCTPSFWIDRPFISSSQLLMTLEVRLSNRRVRLLVSYCRQSEHLPWTRLCWNNFTKGRHRLIKALI